MKMGWQPLFPFADAPERTVPSRILSYNPIRQKFSKLLLIATILTSLLLLPCVGQDMVVRDRTGKILERRVQQGDITRIYDSQGHLLRTEKTHGDRTEIRDRTGKLLETEKQTGNKAAARDYTGKLLQTEQ